MKQEIFNQIKEDLVLREKIGDYLGVSDSTVRSHADRCAPKLNDGFIRDIIMAHTGKSRKEIYTKETLDFIDKIIKRI